MIKRVFCIVTLFTFVFGSIGLSAAPVTAAPPAAVTPAAPNANLMPPDTAIYFNFRAADLTPTVDFLLSTIQQVTGFRPGDPYADINRGLTQFLGRDATFEKDIQSWLGDDITVSFRITDKQLADLSSASASSAMASAFANPEFVAIVSVKDDAAGASFFKEVLGKIPGTELKTRTETVQGEKITVYDQGSCTTMCGSLYEAKGYLAIGTTNSINTVLTMLKSGTPSLNSNATFGTLMKSLKPTNLFTAYLTPRLYQVYAAFIPVMMSMRPSLAGPTTQTPGANAADLMKSALGTIQGQAFAARMDGKVLAFDIAQKVDLNAVNKLYQSLGFSPQILQNLNKPIQAKLAAQIPDKALAAMIASNIPNLYSVLQQSIEFGAKMNQQMGVPSQRFNADQIVALFQTFQSGLKAAFDLDLNTEVFSWMTGEFALYLTYNPDSMLSKVSKNGQPVPFDVTMLIETSDAAKTRNFLTKLNAGLEKNAHVTIESAGTDLYTATTGDGLPFGYGLVKNTFILSTGTGFDAAVAAANGDGVLSNSAVWKNAQASMVNPTASAWLLNFTQWVPVVEAMTAKASGRSNTKEALALLNLLESASISGGVMKPDGSNTASFQILLK